MSDCGGDPNCPQCHPERITQDLNITSVSQAKRIMTLRGRSNLADLVADMERAGITVTVADTVRQNPPTIDWERISEAKRRVAERLESHRHRQKANRGQFGRAVARRRRKTKAEQASRRRNRAKR